MAGVAPPVFLDRDGTLIVEREYLADPDGAQLVDGALEGLTLLQKNGHPLVVLSNQSGIGRGLFGDADAHRVNARITEMLRRHGVSILAWYICPHAPEAGCDCRKPAPGMALAASRDWNIALPGSYVIGDKRTDLELADAIGATGILVTTGHGRAAAGWARERGRLVFDSLAGAARHIASTVPQIPCPIREQ